MENINNAKLLREVVRMLEKKLGMLDDMQSSCCKVNFSQCHTIVEIGRSGSISLNDLAKVLGLDKSTMSRRINNLVEDEMVLREIDVNDRRYITIRLTEKGLKTFSEIEESMEDYFAKVCTSIPENKQKQVIESLEILLQALPNHD